VPPCQPKETKKANLPREMEPNGLVLPEGILKSLAAAELLQAVQL
jgi:hypothetical protein